MTVLIRMKLQNAVGKEITILAGMRRKLLIGKAGQIVAISEKPHVFGKILIKLIKFPTCFLKYVFQIYGSSDSFVYFTFVDSK